MKHCGNNGAKVVRVTSVDAEGTIMTFGFLILVGLSCAAVFPAYHVSRSKGDESWALIVAPVPAIVVWVAVTASGFGAQSLSNIIEVIGLFAGAVALSYVKVFGLDRIYGKPRVSTYGLVILLVVAALILRATMPTLPE